MLIRMFSLVLCALLLMPASGWAAVAYDNATASHVDGGTSLTYAHTVAGTNRWLLVGVGVTAANTITSVTYNGVAMTDLGLTDSCASHSKIYLFGLLNPATGANNVVVTPNTTSNLAAAAISFTGVDGTTPQAGGVVAKDCGGLSTQASSTPTGFAAGDMQVDIGAADNNWSTSGASQIQRALDNGGNETIVASTATTAVTMTENIGASTWTHASIVVKQVAAGGAAPKNLMLMGVGQ